MSEMRICKCGRIHIVDSKVMDHALEKSKNILLICAGCGKGTMIGSDIEPDFAEPDKLCHMMYAYDFSPYENQTIDTDSFESKENYKGFDKILYSHGHKVPMMTGMYATDYDNGTFSDRWYPDFYKIQRNDITIKEIMDFIDKYTKDRTTVNMGRFIRETPDDVLEIVSHYMIEGFNFKGTKWETEWNSK